MANAGGLREASSGAQSKVLTYTAGLYARTTAHCRSLCICGTGPGRVLRVDSTGTKAGDKLRVTAVRVLRFVVGLAWT